MTAEERDQKLANLMDTEYGKFILGIIDDWIEKILENLYAVQSDDYKDLLVKKAEEPWITGAWRNMKQFRVLFANAENRIKIDMVQKKIEEQQTI